MPLERPALIDTGVWTRVRDHRFPMLADSFNDQVAAGLVLVCDLVAIELIAVSALAARWLVSPGALA